MPRHASAIADGFACPMPLSTPSPRQAASLLHLSATPYGTQSASRGLLLAGLVRMMPTAVGRASDPFRTAPTRSRRGRIDRRDVPDPLLPATVTDVANVP